MKKDSLYGPPKEIFDVINVEKKLKTKQYKKL
jgi:hypothetical protein